MPPELTVWSKYSADQQMPASDGFRESRPTASTARHWVVYAKRPFGGPQQVFRYLGRYSHRVAISNSRLVSMDEDTVSSNGKTTPTASKPR